MSSFAVTDIDDLEICVAAWRVHLRLAGQNREHEDLYCRTSGVPEGAWPLKVSKGERYLGSVLSLPATPYRYPTVALCNKVAAHVQADTMPAAISPGLTLLEAVLNSSDVFVSKRE